GVSVAAAQKDARVVGAAGVGGRVARHEVEFFVAVEIAHREGLRVGAGGEGQGRLERAVRRTQEYAHGAGVVVDDRQVELAVAVEVGRQHGLRVRAGGVAYGGAEAEQAAVFQEFEARFGGRASAS